MDPLHHGRRINGQLPPPQHFFKIVFEENLREGKLGIPPEFVKNYGNMLSSPAFLTVPTGKGWEVELIKRDGKIWLENGWRQFAQHCSLEFGHFLVFRYEGSSNFHVLIFDRSATEIKYPKANENEEIQQQEAKIEQSDEEEDSIEIIDCIPTGRRGKPQLQSFRPSKMMRTSPNVKTERGSTSNSAAMFECENDSSVRKRSGNSTAICSLRQLNGDEKYKVLGFQKAGLNSNNPYFIVVMQPTHIGLGCLCIPADFARKYLKDHGDAILCDSEGITWSATYHSSLGITTRLPYVKLSWTAFVRDNNLTVGDICAFELIDCTKISFKVFIDRGHQEAAFQASRASKSILTARAFKSENPICVVKLQPSYVQKQALYIPEEFARTYFPKTLRTVDITLCMNGRSWPAEYHQKGIGRVNASICNGWRDFVQDNNLQVGNLCLLEMTNENSKTTFNVFIYHDIADANGYPSQGVIRRPIRLPSNEAPKRPIFKTAVRASHLKEKQVDIPFKVYDQYFRPSIQMVRLEVADRLWPVKIGSNTSYRLAKLTSGWGEFARDNNLSEGDVCFFNLDTKRKDLLKVSISRQGH